MIRETEYRSLPISPEALAAPEANGLLLPIEVNRDNGEIFTLDTYGVDARSGGSRRTIVYCQPWSDMCAAPFNQERMKLIAEAANARIIGIDNPGAGLHTSDLTPDMSAELRGGNYSEVAQLIWRAAEKHPLFDPEETDELVLGLNSLGASVSAELAAHAPEGVQIDRFVWYEGVAFQEMKPFKFMKNYIVHGGGGRNEYLRQNPDWVGAPRSGGEVALHMKRQLSGFYAYPRAMAIRTIGAAMSEAREREAFTTDTLFQIANGSLSEVSSTPENDRLAAHVRGLGAQVCRAVYTGENHPMFDSLPKVNAFMRDTFRI